MIDPSLQLLILKLRLIVFDFDGVFTDNSVYVSQDGVEMVRCWRSDGLGLRLLDEVGVRYMVISTEANPVVTLRCKKLKIRCVQGCEDKVSALEQLLKTENISWEQTGYLGNDINDKGCLERVTLPMVVQDAYDAVIPLGKLRTTARGGYGAVREVCDLVHKVKMERPQ
ncbi:MAG: 3-deoxy-D-manno-octulosonate 8-phosphate phosphatase [Verrucomicrobiota bacterium]|nr:3-deoxy-D-manno-octulosonate 8-phosphate phosphatase [Verrucomicrobiota bacterium]